MAHPFNFDAWPGDVVTGRVGETDFIGRIRYLDIFMGSADVALDNGTIIYGVRAASLTVVDPYIGPSAQVYQYMDGYAYSDRSAA